MYKIALKMLIEDKAKFVGMILSLSFSAVIITQQIAIFKGIMKRTYCTITDTSIADIWVMDPNVKYIDDILPLRDTDLFRVRSIQGVKWAVPFYKGTIRSRMTTGQFQTCILIGVDDSTYIGAPHTMLQGNVEDLGGPDAIIVNKVGAENKLALYQGPNLPPRPLRIGDRLELNDQRANVVGICDVTRTFQSQPVIYTTYNRALQYSPFERKRLSFILVKSDGSIPVKELCRKISQTTHFAAYTKKEFEALTVDYYLKNTGIPLNFGIAVLLGLLVGIVIAGQIFYNFVSDNSKYLALFLVMGASRSLLVKMSLIQAIWVGLIGWGIGSGCSALLGFLTRKTELSYFISWGLFLGTGLVIISICMMALLISIARIFKIELANVFKQ